MVRVVIDKRSMSADFLSRWEEDMAISQAMFAEAGVEVTIFDETA